MEERFVLPTFRFSGFPAVFVSVCFLHSSLYLINSVFLQPLLYFTPFFHIPYLTLLLSFPFLTGGPTILCWKNTQKNKAKLSALMGIKSDRCTFRLEWYIKSFADLSSWYPGGPWLVGGIDGWMDEHPAFLPLSPGALGRLTTKAAF